MAVITIFLRAWLPPKVTCSPVTVIMHKLLAGDWQLLPDMAITHLQFSVRFFFAVGVKLMQAFQPHFHHSSLSLKEKWTDESSASPEAD